MIAWAMSGASAFACARDFGACGDGNLKWADAPGNVLLAGRVTGLPKDAVAKVAQIVSLDRGLLTERVGQVPSGI